MNGIKLCHEAGIAVAANSCLGKEDFYNGNFQKVIEKAKELGVSIIQIIHPKPAGGWLENGADKFSTEDFDHIRKLVDAYNLDPKYGDYPSISAQIMEEADDRFGCTAGGTDRFYINAKGDLQPCEFLNISFGNIMTDDFDALYEKMRAVFKEAHTCWVCEKYSASVRESYRKNNLSTLPLPPEISKEIYKNWNTEKKTPAYEKLEKMR